MKIQATTILAAVCFLCGSGLAQAVTLVHRYSFDEGSEMVDSVGANDGVLIGGANVAAGELILDNTNGNGVSATSMGFTSPIDIGVNFGASGVTIETWYTDTGSSGWAKLFTFSSPADGPVGGELAFTDQRAGGDLVPGIDRNGAHFLDSYPQGSDTRIPLNVEHHLVMTVESDGTTSLWVDGILEIDGIGTNPLANVQSGHEAIGATSWGDPGHLGSVNEFRVWSGTFGSTEVQASMVAGPDSLPSADDSDLDGLLDIWEERWFGVGNLTQGPDDNPDDDGLTNLEEFTLNQDLDPDDADTDDDGLDDGAEVLTHMTNPLDDDSDDDTLLDGAEVEEHMTDPLLEDSDMDFFPDPMEIANGTDPNDPNDPGQLEKAELAHRYSFLDGADLVDSVGGIDGVLVGTAGVGGGSLILDGAGSGPTASSMQFTDTIGIGENIGPFGTTVETWYTDNGSGTWAKTFTFGTNVAGMELAYTNVRGDPMEAGIDRDGAKLLGPSPTQNEEHHLVVTVSPDGNLNTWIDGAQLLTDVDTNDLSNVVSTTESIGSTAWGDPGHTGSVNEFRIWRGELTPAEVADNLLLGPDVIGSDVPFAVTEVEYDEGTGKVKLTWNSVPGRTYAVDRSPDLQEHEPSNWIEVDDGVVATDEISTFEDTPPPDTSRMFYQVRDVTG